jgi:glycosyltransferase involved in cell wall biosynthesis
MKKIAILTQGAEHPGGVTTLVNGLSEWLIHNSDYQPTVISLAESRSDPSSRSMLSPKSWRIKTLLNKNPDFQGEHWGVNCVDLEPFRYLPNRELTNRLNSFDLIQVVSGSLSLAFSTTRAMPPTVAQAATRISWERESQIRSLPKVERAARRAVLAAVTYQERRAAKHVDLILTMNNKFHEYVRHDLKVSSERAELLPPGIDTDLFVPNLSGSANSGGYLLYLGRLNDRRKGLDRLLEAYKLMRVRMPNVPPLLLAGYGELAQPLQSFILDNNMSKSVRVLSNVPETDLPSLCAGATLFLQASREEGLGLSVLQSMSCGVPVIATSTDGTLETVEHGVTGYLVAQGSVGSVAKEMSDRAIYFLQNDSDEMRANSRSFVEQRFSVQENYLEFKNRYDEIISRHLKNGKRV